MRTEGTKDRLATTQLNGSAKLVDVLLEDRVRGEMVLNGLVGMNNSAMVPPAKMEANRLQGRICQLFGEIHRNLAGEDDFLFPGLRPEEIWGHVVELRDDALNFIYRDRTLHILHDNAKNISRQGQINIAGLKGRSGKQADEAAFEFADIGCYVRSNEIDHLLREVEAVFLALLVEDGDARLEIGGLDVSSQARLEPRDQTVIKTLELLWGNVRRQDNLFAQLIQRVEGMEKVVLCLLFPGKELDIINNQEVDGTIEL